VAAGGLGGAGGVVTHGRAAGAVGGNVGPRWPCCYPHRTPPLAAVAVAVGGGHVVTAGRWRRSVAAGGGWRCYRWPLAGRGWPLAGRWRWPLAVADWLRLGRAGENSPPPVHFLFTAHGPRFTGPLALLGIGVKKKTRLFPKNSVFRGP